MVPSPAASHPARPAPGRVSALALSVAVLGWVLPARAQSIIRHPGDHPQYSVELEPHLVLGVFDAPGDTDDPGLGAGLRLTIPVVDNGFVQTINNSVGISFGLDWVHHWGDDAGVGYCAAWIPGPAGTSICTRVADSSAGPTEYFYFPAAMQWNFWIHRRFSAFGEPGLALYYRSPEAGDGKLGAVPLFMAGGRYHFSDLVTLAFRLGYPTLSLGVSFFL